MKRLALILSLLLVGAIVFAEEAPDTIILPASTAQLHGDLIFQAKPGMIGRWTKTSELVTWEYDFPKNGKYLVELTYSCPAKHAGAEVHFLYKTSDLDTRINDTGSWKDPMTVKLGDAMIFKGKGTVTVKPAKIPHRFAMNLYSIKLTPIK